MARWWCLVLVTGGARGHPLGRRRAVRWLARRVLLAAGRALGVYKALLRVAAQSNVASLTGFPLASAASALDPVDAATACGMVGTATGLAARKNRRTGARPAGLDLRLVRTPRTTAPRRRRGRRRRRPRAGHAAVLVRLQRWPARQIRRRRRAVQSTFELEQVAQHRPNSPVSKTELAVSLISIRVLLKTFWSTPHVDKLRLVQTFTSFHVQKVIQVPPSVAT